MLLACVPGVWLYLHYIGPLGDEAILRRVRGHPQLASSHLLQFLGDLGTTSVALPASEVTFGALVDSYPSGHTVYATTVFGMLAWLAWEHGRRDAAVVLAGLVVAMGPARVLSSAHLASDVVGGYLLGSAWLLVAVTAYAPPRRRPHG